MHKISYISAAVVCAVLAHVSFAEDNNKAPDSTSSFQIRPVYFPPVPSLWTQSIDGNKVVYSSEIDEKTKAPATIISIEYSSNTNNQTVDTIINDYAKTNKCSAVQMYGKGFYITQCSDLNSFFIIIGEPNNAYSIDVKGIYSPQAKSLIENYIDEITTGKYVFQDRSIGDSVK